MRRPGLGAERLVGLFLIGAVGLSPPILTLFNKPDRVAGIPLLYLYLFALWLGLVVLAGLVIARLGPGDDALPQPDRDAAAEDSAPNREGRD